MLGYDKAMNTPEPAREIDTLLDHLADACNGSIQIDADSLAQMAWQAKKCLRTDPAEAHMALGLIAMQRWDQRDAETEFQEALRYGWYPLLALNYAAALHRFHRLEDALKQVCRVIDKGPGAYFTDALETAVQCAYEIGRFHAATHLLALLRQHTEGPVSGIVEAIATELPPLVTAAETLALPDDVIAAATEQAWAVIRRSETHFKVEIDDFVGNDGDLFLSRTLRLPIPFEDAYRLDQTLMALQAESEIPLSKFCVSLQSDPAA